MIPYTVGLIFHESEAQAVLCKPKLLPLKSFTLEKLEKMQKEATAKAQETILDKQRELETQFYPGTNSGKNTNRQLFGEVMANHCYSVGFLDQLQIKYLKK